MPSLSEMMELSRPFTVEDRKRSWFHLLSTILVWAGFVAVAASPLAWPYRAIGSFFAGLTVVRLFILYHDYQHGAIFRDSKLAGGFFSFYGLFVLNPPQVWNRSHNYHHSKNAQIATASIGSFPIMTVEAYYSSPWYVRLRYRLARHPLTILFGYVPIFLLGMCLASFVTDPKRHFDSLVAIVLHLAILSVLWYFDPAIAVWAYLFPLMSACALGGYMFYIQHNFPDMKLRSRQDWDFLYAAMKASSFMDGSPLTHWFTGNIGYHHVHHLNSRIPFYRLPEAMRAIPELQDPGRTTLKPMDMYRCLRLKLWDPQRDQMLSFAEARLAAQGAMSASRA